MTAWRAWQPSAVAEWRSATCPCLVRFAGSRAPPAAPRPPTRAFPSFWADLTALSARELDFFARCVDHIAGGVGQGVPTRVERALSAERSAPAGPLCDVVLLPDGQPCLGWFHDGFDARHYAAVLAALEERWRRCAASVWALRGRVVAAEAARLSANGRHEYFVAPADEWRRARLEHCAARHSRAAAECAGLSRRPRPAHSANVSCGGEALPALVAQSRGAVTPRARDAAIAAALRQCAAGARSVERDEAAVLQRHAAAARHCDGRATARGECGLIDAAALDAAIAPAERFSLEPRGEPETSSAAGFGPAWMPGVGADARGYVSGLLAACDALVGMTAGSAGAAPNDAQRAASRLQHILRVHVARRFGFALPAALWSSAALAARAEPFLRALLDSLETPSSCRAVIRVRDGTQLPRPFDAADFPSPVLCALQQTLQLPAASPAFFVECGSVEELEAAGAARRLACSFTPSGGDSFSVAFAAKDGVIGSVAAAAREAMRRGPEKRFADIEVHLRAGAVSLAVGAGTMCSPTAVANGEEERRKNASGEAEEQNE